MFTKLKQSLSVWLIRKIQKHGPHTVEVLGKAYEVSKDVFNPGYYYTSEFMARHIKVSPEDIVLDVGTGSGIQAITAGQTASRVTAVDINPEAVRFAKKNIRNNGLDHVVSVINGDLFSPLSPKIKFSVILFTPPYLEGIPKTHFDNALFDSDKELVRRFFKEAKGYIKQDGYVQMIYSSIADPEQTIEISEQSGWDHTIIAREKTLTEEFIIYKLMPN